MNSATLRHPSARAAFFTLLALLACWPYLSTAGTQNDFRDAQVLDHYEATARRTVLEYGQFPLWNPYSCGGLYALGSPQTRFASPPFFATLLFGTFRGAAIVHWLLVLLALEGAFRFLRAHRVRTVPAMLAAPIYGLGGIFACAPFLGWVSFCGFAAMPWAVWATQQALCGRRWGVPMLAACTAFMAGFGGTYTLPLTAVACGAEFIAPLVRRQFMRVVSTALAMMFGALGLCAFRLLPIWETLHDAPRIVASLEAHSLTEVAGFAFGTGAPFTGPECWYLIGMPAAILAALELLRWRRAGWLLAALVACVWFAMGQAATPSLFGALRHAPGFNMLRWPERFMILAGLIIAVGAGRALTSLFARVRLFTARTKTVPAERWRTAAVIAIGALLINAAMQISNFGAAAKNRTLVAEAPDVRQPFHQARGNRWAVSEFGAMNRGSLSCYEAYPVPQARALRGDLEHEAWLQDRAAGRLTEVGWSPNVLTYALALNGPARVMVNQNFHSGWRASLGKVVSDHGQLAVDVPAAVNETLTLSFRPRSAIVGFTVSALTLAALLTSLFVRLPQWLLLAAPLLMGFAQFKLINEASPPPQQLDAEGLPIIAEAVEAGFPRFDIDFEGGVRLEAASLTRLPSGQVRLELDWQVPERAVSTLGIFVHVEPEGGTTVNGDHPLVSETLRFEELPVGKTARDVTLISLPPDARGKNLTVWAGLWALRGDGARQKILTQTAVPIDADRVQIGKLPAE